MKRFAVQLCVGHKERKQQERHPRFLSQETVDHDESREYVKRNVQLYGLGDDVLNFGCVPERWWKMLYKQLDLRIWTSREGSELKMQTWGLFLLEIDDFLNSVSSLKKNRECEYRKGLNAWGWAEIQLSLRSLWRHRREGGDGPRKHPAASVVNPWAPQTP